MESEPKVFVVDDDEAMCGALQCLLESEGFPVVVYDSAEAFLQGYQAGQPGCLVLDVRMRGMSGLDLQARLAEQGLVIPIIITTGHGDVPMAVRAMRFGAMDFLEKPVNDRVLIACIRKALKEDARIRQELTQRGEVIARMKSLTPREREVMEHVLVGRANKQIAARLGISEKTVEVHRKHVMHKMDVHCAIELVRVVLETDQYRDRQGAAESQARRHGGASSV